MPNGSEQWFGGDITRWIDRGLLGEGFKVTRSDGEDTVPNVAELVVVMDAMEEELTCGCTKNNHTRCREQQCNLGR